jgi:hypothetical protein
MVGEKSHIIFSLMAGVAFGESGTRTNDLVAINGLSDLLGHGRGIVATAHDQIHSWQATGESERSG